MSYRIGLLCALLLTSLGTYAATAPETITPEHRAAVVRAYQQQATTTLNGKPRRVTLKERILRRWVKRKMRRATRRNNRATPTHQYAWLSVGFNVMALALGIIGFAVFNTILWSTWLFLLAAFAAQAGVVMGVLALRAIKKSKGEYRGRNLALYGGIVAGSVLIIAAMIGLFVVAKVWLKLLRGIASAFGF